MTGLDVPGLAIGIRATAEVVNGAGHGRYMRKELGGNQFWFVR
jgi:hypothetical protein